MRVESVGFNETQRLILLGFAAEDSLERMVAWLSDGFSVSINVVVLSYIKTSGGDEVLTRTSIISEELDKERAHKRKFKIPMSDEPGTYEESELRSLLSKYLTQSTPTARWIREVLLPECLEAEVVIRDELKEAIVRHDPTSDLTQAGYKLSVISGQLGMKKNDFLRQVIKYGYPHNAWEKDNYQIRDGCKELVVELLHQLSNSEKPAASASDVPSAT